MNNYIINSSTLAEIGDTIRDKSGISESIPVPEIPKHIENVYECGKQSMVDETKILKKTVSGSFLYFEDVSETPHSVAIKLVSDTVSNFSDINVTICGKNLLFNKTGNATIHNIDYSTNPDGTLNINGTTKTNSDYYFFGGSSENESSFIAEQDLVLSSNRIYEDGNNVIFARTSTGLLCIPKSGYVEIPAGTRIDGIAFRVYNKSVDLKNVYVQLECGKIATEYEPYTEQKVRANTNGSVDGITSLSPYMNIMTDSTDVNIEATYHKSWGMQTALERLFHDSQQEMINTSISFEWLLLDKQNITRIVNALSALTEANTLVLGIDSVNTAFETSSGAADGSASNEWAELISTKPNWQISLV